MSLASIQHLFPSLTELISNSNSIPAVRPEIETQGMYGGGADIGTKGYQEVVVIVQVRCGGDADSGLGGGMDRGGRGDRRDGDRYIISTW